MYWILQLVLWLVTFTFANGTFIWIPKKPPRKSQFVCLVRFSLKSFVYYHSEWTLDETVHKCLWLSLPILKWMNTVNLQLNSRKTQFWTVLRPFYESFWEASIFWALANICYWITTLVFPCFASFLVKLKWELNVEYCAALAMLLYRFRKKQYFWSLNQRHYKAVISHYNILDWT